MFGSPNILSTVSDFRKDFVSKLFYKKIYFSISFFPLCHKEPLKRIKYFTFHRIISTSNKFFLTFEEKATNFLQVMQTPFRYKGCL